MIQVNLNHGISQTVGPRELNFIYTSIINHGKQNVTLTFMIIDQYHSAGVTYVAFILGRIQICYTSLQCFNVQY